MSSAWKPRSSGDYSPWRRLFNAQIKRFCKDPNSFSNSRSISLPFPLSNQEGIGHFRNVLETQGIKGYVFSKGNHVALLIIAVVICLMTIGSVITVKRSCRRKLRKLVNPYSKHHESGGHKLRIFKYLSLLSFIFMGFFGGACVYYAVVLANALDATSCDFWQSVKGHYFGALDLKESPKIAMDWKGTNKQLKEMKKLRTAVSPVEEEDPETKRQLKSSEVVGPRSCPVCEEIFKAFDSDENSLAQKLISQSNSIGKETMRNAYLNEAIGYYIRAFPFLDLSVENNITVKWEGGGVGAPSVTPIKMQFANFLPLMLSEHGPDWDGFVKQAIALIRADIDTHFGHNSEALSMSNDAVTNSIASINDVDYLVARMIGWWEKTLGDKLKLFSQVAYITSWVLGGLAIAFSVGGLVVLTMMWQKCRFSSIMTKGLGVAYVFLLVISGASILISASLFLVGTFGSDGCRFILPEVFIAGNWNILPQDLLRRSATNRTSIPALLETCIKQNGDGDVAASLGIKMLLSQLEQAFAVTGSALSDTIKEKLDFRGKGIRSRFLSELLEVTADLVHTERPFVSANLNTIRTQVSDEFVVSGADHVFPRIGGSNIAHITFVDGMFSGNSGEFPGLMALLELAEYWLRDFFPNAVPSDEALKKLNEVLADEIATLKGDVPPFSSVCAPYLAAAEVCSLDDPTVYILNGQANMTSTKGSNFTALKNPFSDPVFNNLLSRLDEKKKVLLTVIQQTAAIMQLDWFVGASLETVFETDAFFETNIFGYKGFPVITALVDEIFLLHADTDMRLDALIETLLPKIECAGARYKSPNKVSRATSIDFSECTMLDVLDALNKVNTELASSLKEIFESSSREIVGFIRNKALKSFEPLLDGANRNFDDFNCQFIGTSVKQGAVSDMCEVVVPSLIYLGLTKFFLWLCFCLGALSTWKLFHHYRDPENFKKYTLEGSNPKRTTRKQSQPDEPPSRMQEYLETENSKKPGALKAGQPLNRKEKLSTPFKLPSESQEFGMPDTSQPLPRTSTWTADNQQFKNKGGPLSRQETWSTSRLSTATSQQLGTPLAHMSTLRANSLRNKGRPLFRRETLSTSFQVPSNSQEFGAPNTGQPLSRMSTWAPNSQQLKNMVRPLAHQNTLSTSFTEPPDSQEFGGPNTGQPVPRMSTLSASLLSTARQQLKKRGQAQEPVQTPSGKRLLALTAGEPLNEDEAWPTDFQPESSVQQVVSRRKSQPLDEQETSSSSFQPPSYGQQAGAPMMGRPQSRQNTWSTSFQPPSYEQQVGPQMMAQPLDQQETWPTSFQPSSYGQQFGAPMMGRPLARQNTWSTSFQRPSYEQQVGPQMMGQPLDQHETWPTSFQPPSYGHQFGAPMMGRPQPSQKAWSVESVEELPHDQSSQSGPYLPDVPVGYRNTPFSAQPPVRSRSIFSISSRSEDLSHDTAQSISNQSKSNIVSRSISKRSSSVSLARSGSRRSRSKGSKR